MKIIMLHNEFFKIYYFIWLKIFFGFCKFQRFYPLRSAQLSQFRSSWSALHSQFRWRRSYLIFISIKLHQHIYTKYIRYGITENIFRI